MNPALSVVFLTVLIGAGQGLFLALYGCELAGFGATPQERDTLGLGAALALVFTGLGLLASFFHLGHPERAWRAAAMWRSSWLSREVIALPAFMAACAAWGGAQWLALPGTRALGAIAALACLALFVCTGMVYASIRFLQEWASPLTLVNYLLIGCASGATLAALLASLRAPALAPVLALAALALTLAALIGRAAALARNARLRPRSTLQSAIGVKHPMIRQRAQGFMGGSFNTREFFHGRSAAALRTLKWFFLAAGFAVPAALLALAPASPAPLLLAVAVQLAGLLAERWFFFAQANHPQNLYYQAIS
ncbi:MAG: dimethyl sulfoxide reductase anchor subunit [Piscinibacter sp.]|uniref:dimethyl sulfoxide reductase anchor subunit family protein n=1 Tax=Piscinibacter sp. TaxID=1903157 RepID=UPI001B67A67D|nr:DmsC/YnfH family molybdoenzyme membrane anchor subunit [Piscinibacter sp.]MBP5991938.1 dimethyl sulfoxide reductase anchor subunit [Piscinibacter sp.]MBP6029371.1 dimethyl sulfoxide reductase anchor subunit [Piscinibacter sp.]